MERNEFESAVANGKLGGVYIFEGSEENLKQQALKLVEKAVLPEGLEELNESASEETDTDKIIAMAETMPFMADKRLVVIRNHPALVANKEADDSLAEYIDKVPSYCLLIFYCVGKANGTKKLYKAVKKCGQIVNFSPMSEAELNSWIANQFKLNGKDCAANVAANVAFTVGSDTALLKTEISKIAASIGEKKKVSVEDVQSIATKSTESRIFDLVNAVVAGNEALAFKLLGIMLSQGEQRIGILALLLRQYRMMQQVKIMKMNKATSAAIAAHLNVKSFAADKYIRQADQYTPKQIKEGVNILLETEYKIKSGQISDNGGLESALLSLFALKHPQEES